MSQPTFSRWDLCRFLKTLTFFGAVPFLGSLPWLARTASNPVRDGDTHSSANAAETKGAVAIAVGSGTFAVALAESLTAQGYTPVAWVDRDEPVAEALRDRSQVVPVDWSDPQSLQAAMPPALHGILCTAPQPPAPETEAGIVPDTGSLPLLLDAAVQRIVGRDHRMLFDFSQRGGDLAETWGAIDDVVMGGVSQSDMQLLESTALFAGQVSTANSGGFASVRTRNFEPVLNLADSAGIVLRLRGDGQRYKFFVRTETQWDGLAYSASFDTVADMWMEVRLPFEDFVPVFRAKTVSDAGPLDRDRIRALQLMLSKFEYDGNLNPAFHAGNFRLELASIQAYRGQPAPQLIWLSLPTPQRDRAEAQVRQRRLPYTIIQASELTAVADNRALQLSQQQPANGAVNFSEIGTLCGQLLSKPTAAYTTVAAIAADSNWDTQLTDLQPDADFDRRR